mgnify:CR=1 FL=1
MASLPCSVFTFCETAPRAGPAISSCHVRCPAYVLRGSGTHLKSPKLQALRDVGAGQFDDGLAGWVGEAGPEFRELYKYGGILCIPGSQVVSQR